MADQSSHWPAQYPALKREYRAQTRFNPAMRAATADRERTVDVLKAGFAEGRLTQDEYNDRMAKAYDARTYGDLAGLVRDLPAGAMPHPPAHPAFPAVPATRSHTNSTAIAALVLGLGVPFFGVTAIPAVICGHKARREIRRTGEQGDGMAVAGLVLGYLAITIGVLLILAAMAFAARQAAPAQPFP